MSGHDFKGPGLIRAGFQYQDLVALETLIDFYRQRDLYSWVELDAEDRDFRSIEDVVACLPDGRFELTQVKFAADPNATPSALSWDWLLARRGKGSSLLQKWAATTLARLADKTLAKASLKTDRIPEAAFEACLDGDRIEWTRVPEAVAGRLVSELGSAERAAAFFEAFRFMHSMPRLDDLEEQLWRRIASDTDRGGWSLFRDQVARWSTRKGQPHPDGRIRHIHLRQAFAIERPRPMPQDFLVPASYSVPDASFDTAFLRRVVGQDGVTVLWGPPGRGKSTYLSRCLSRIDKKAAVCLRHHYFLSLEDRSEGRFHFAAISRSLQEQLNQATGRFDERVAELGERLAAGAQQLAAEGRRLILVIDGLDHVWREHRDREDMEALFAALLPLPANTTLVVGTQKIDAAQLPTRLVAAAPAETWTELPLMSPDAVRAWLTRQDAAGRLNLEERAGQGRHRQVSEVALAFHEVSQGLPLHLIYSFEALARTGEPVTAADVKALPACPTGDIRDYYRSFWTRAGPDARVVLHVLAGLEFGPPPAAMPQCFGRSDGSMVALSEISHLLDLRETGVQPFHGSLFAFIRELPDHAGEFARHAPHVLRWLTTDAPTYWRWAWHWITAWQLGDASLLLNGPSRAWAVESLVAGYPIEQLVMILRHAERAAFDAFDLPALAGFRALKVRALDGPEFQTDEWPLFPEVAISLSNDPHVAAMLRGNLLVADSGLLPFAVRTADPSVRAAVSSAAIAELNRRISQRRDEQYSSESAMAGIRLGIVGVVACRPGQEARRVVNFTSARADTELTAYARAARLAGHPENVLAIGRLAGGEALDREVLATLSFEGLGPSARPGLKARTHPALCCLERLKGGTPPRVRTRRDLSSLFAGNDRFAEGTREALYGAFFAALSAALGGRNARGWSKLPDKADGAWLAEVVETLEEIAQGIGHGWIDTRAWPTIRDFYGAFPLPRPETRTHEADRRFIAVRLALRDIAVDLCTLGVAVEPGRKIGRPDIMAAATSPFWLDELWLDEFAARRLPLHASDAAAHLCATMGQFLDEHVTEFNERTSMSLRLARFALDSNLVDIARRELRRAAECLLGYGWRKDMFALEVIDSLVFLAGKGDARALGRLFELAGPFEAITDYTDGDETNYIRRNFHEALCEFFPAAAAACYVDLLANEEWRYAEDLIKAFAERADLESLEGRLLLETFLIPSETATLEDLAGSERPVAAEALSVVKRRLGAAAPARTVERRRAQRDASASAPETVETDEVPDPSAFMPGDLAAFLKAVGGVRDYTRQRGLAGDWLRYWQGQGRALDALADLEQHYQTRKLRSWLDETFDAAFEVSLQVEGRTLAWRWLVRAHVAQYGWQRFYTSAEANEARMRKVAQVYPDKWRDFIRETAHSAIGPRGRDESIVFGHSRLVTFLVEVGQASLATDFTLAMSQVFAAELTAQPITTPAWAR